MYSIYSDSADGIIGSGFDSRAEAEEHVEALVARGEDPEDLWVVEDGFSCPSCGHTANHDPRTGCEHVFVNGLAKDIQCGCIQ